MDLCNQLCSYIWPDGQAAVCLTKLHGQNFNIEHNVQTFQSKFFIPSMFVGIIDFFLFIPLPMIFTLAWGHKISAKQNLLASFSHKRLSWCGQNLI